MKSTRNLLHCGGYRSSANRRDLARERTLRIPKLLDAFTEPRHVIPSFARCGKDPGEHDEQDCANDEPDGGYLQENGEPLILDLPEFLHVSRNRPLPDYDSASDAEKLRVKHHEEGSKRN